MNEWEITLGNYDNSLNFIFGLTGEDLSTGQVDILNNPYVRFVGLERTLGRKFTEKYEFEICSDEFQLRFIGEHALEVQPGTVCSCDQEVVAMGMASSPGGAVDLHQLGKMGERLVVTPNVDHLLQGREQPLRP